MPLEVVACEVHDDEQQLEDLDDRERVARVHKELGPPLRR